MNIERLLRVVNIFFVICGFQIHWLDLKKRKYQVSILSAVIFLCYAVWYICCVVEHYRHLEVLTSLIRLSPFLYDLKNVHLAWGIFSTIFTLFNCKKLAKVSTRILQTFSREDKCFQIEEIPVYFYLFSTLCFSLCVIIYDVSQLNPKFDIDSIMLLSALITPHFSVSCVLKYLCIVMWIAKLELRFLRFELVEALEEKFQTKEIVATVEECVVNCFEMALKEHDDPVSKKPQQIQLVLSKLQDICKTLKKFNKAVQGELLLLFIQNVLAVIGAAHVIMYFHLVWSYVLTGREESVLKVTHLSYFALILWDYFFLTFTNHLLTLEIKKFRDCVNDYKSNESLEYGVKIFLYKMKHFLHDGNPFRILWVLKIDWRTLLIATLQTTTAVSIYILYQYVNLKLLIFETNQNFKKFN